MKLKGKKEFTQPMWELANGSAEYFCIACGKGTAKKVGMWTCSSKRCKLQKPIEEFSKAIEMHGGEATKLRYQQRRCNACYTCSKCKKVLRLLDFEPDNQTC